ncbi:endonuclease [Pseudomonas phage vB_PpuM-Amme-3]|uniref:Endonuclease n=1 Tax=Pseudomonas phage vB_PpuM-Amme-3 TaxID=3132617 RepID=A0AAX4MX75_9CAUD
MCKRCGAEKPLSDYYKGDKTCKVCRCAMVRANRTAKIEQYREYDRERNKRPDRIDARADWQQTYAGKESKRKTILRYRGDYPLKYKAHIAVNNAVRDGVIVKPNTCEVCGDGGRIEGHHDDYAQLLSVRWLCVKCHNDWHDLHGEAANAS